MKKEKIKLSAIIKTDNSEDTICNLLESINNLDEIIVVDCHSKDDTIEIAKEYKAKIIFSDKNELTDALNSAADEANNEWIIFLEDDEIVQEGFLKKVEEYIFNPKKNKFCIEVLLKTFLNKKEFKPLKKNELRVFKKSYAEFYQGQLKLLQGKIFKTSKFESVLKYKKINIEKSLLDIIEKNKHLSKIYEKPKVSLFFKPLNTFLYWYFIKGAWMNSKTGYIYSIQEAINAFILQIMLYEKDVKSDI